MTKCNGCGEEIHYVRDKQRPEKWHAYNANNSQHYCGGPKKEFVVTAVPAATAPTELGDITLSQREWGHLREQLVAIQMQLSEIWQEAHTIRSLIEAAALEKKDLGKWKDVVPGAGTASIEDQINEIDFDKVFKDHFPT